ncbi:AGE family epimerase/isomerase [Salinimicrobium sp. MT39]|uniref:AGE family epimerase/isomerase n=1 Tax=Salinimicrobium profundisediminis TaxID=2994553 RepID=A0A9X3CW88_9FLAO|nr:AGE family epimerase/isomerase [Salinimicrobium profundisediminis]MCX2836619.1 AGE family epimerase/isomerase [Salinimicrobium profundisediminis]
MRVFGYSLLSALIFTACVSTQDPEGADDEILVEDFEIAAKEQLLNKWYPLSLDHDNGGYYSQITRDFKLGKKQDKMIVTQARHIWTNAIAGDIYPEKQMYLNNAEHGFQFLQDEMWDYVHGGFYNFVTKDGEPVLQPGQEKTAYGNAFAIYGLAEYYRASGNQMALELAINTFYWLEAMAYDPVHKGYFNVLGTDGKPIARTPEWPSTSDVGYKDQNSSIHILEAFTTLYEVWPDELLRERLEEMLILVRDTIITEKGYMNLFFEPNWKPVSFQDRSREEVNKHYYLDHVSFGHDVETAYLMLEASHALGMDNDSLTLQKGKKMVDHSLRNGWDQETGGFYDGGYYFKGEDQISILNSRKNWWAQAEGLNTLLIMSRYFPEDERNYRDYFEKQWGYIKKYIIDDEFGGWYEWGLDKDPEAKEDLKGHVWKATYHDFRALQNVIKILREEKPLPYPGNLK